MLRTSVLVALVLALCACDRVSIPPGQHDLVVVGRQILVKPMLARDFMPITPPGGNPLAVSIELEAPDSLALPPGLAATRAWLVCRGDIWETELTAVGCYGPAYSAAYWAGGGPKWTPGLPVDVTVWVSQDGGGEWAIIIRDCVVQRVW